VEIKNKAINQNNKKTKSTSEIFKKSLEKPSERIKSSEKNDEDDKTTSQKTTRTNIAGLLENSIKKDFLSKTRYSVNINTTKQDDALKNKTLPTPSPKFQSKTKAGIKNKNPQSAKNNALRTIELKYLAK